MAFLNGLSRSSLDGFLFPSLTAPFVLVSSVAGCGDEEDDVVSRWGGIVTGGCREQRAAERTEAR